MYKCFGAPAELRERRPLLAALFDRFEGGMPQQEASAFLILIDDAVPHGIKREDEIDLELIDSIRLQLGLPTLFN